ncbi:MAG: phosphoenolpyruvate carboxykinase (ATP) [Candidatus Neomarinimicrobiota bacterium]|nr:phosphoenolpyruvate carboxykinase (ATP) [Candidatus Neomarinimicrobiota bacterium]
MKKLENDFLNLGINNFCNIKHNLPVECLVEEIVKNNEGVIGLNGAVMVDTGAYTGRSPNDKFFVDESSSNEKLWWGPVNKKIDEDIFNELYDKVIKYYNDSPLSTYVFDGYAGADLDFRLNVRVIAKKAWQAHFCNNMFIRMSKRIENFKSDFTIINASDVINEDYAKHGLNSETFILFHLGKKIAIIGGTEYGGEMKKGIFSVLHYILPLQGVLSMHCSANMDDSTGNSALFFGLSGTGKTTLSTDPNRPLIGDDEHGWSDNGIFNFEGGCYAKVIRLDRDAEPDIYNAIRHGALLENVVYDENTRVIDFNDGSKTENTRVSYPLDHIKNSIFSSGKPSMGSHPTTIIFLTCDAYGVLPPISKLSEEQSMYHFISGYTAKVAGTERGITEPKATFSPCFGGPFLTQHPLVYAELLKKKMARHGSKVYLVNTGWIGGSASSGAKRISIQNTRAMITAILDGSIEKSEFKIEPVFNLSCPLSLKGVDSSVLNPRDAWNDVISYDKQAAMLVDLFCENFKKYGSSVSHLESFGPIRNKELIM